MKQFLFWFTFLHLIFSDRISFGSDQTPGPPQRRPLALVGGTIHPIAGDHLAGTLLFDQGRIVAIGNDLTLPPNTEVFDITGQHVYPGFFDAYTRLGLVEIDAVRATVDSRETGRINPNVLAQVAVNPGSELIPVARSNGVLLALAAPAGGLLSGQSAVLQLDGWTYEDLTLKPRAGLHVVWPYMTSRRDRNDPHSAEFQNSRRDESLQVLRQTFEDARAYHVARRQAPDDHPVDLRWEAMRSVFERQVPLVVEANDLAQIYAAVAFAEQQQARLMIYGGYDAPHCVELLKKHDVPVIIAGVYRLPARRSDDVHAGYTVAARLHEAGVKFCIAGSGPFAASNVRNLPYHASTAVAYGLPRDVALKAITQYPAEMFGLQKQIGTLEAGKHATLFVCDGDPLETATSITHAFVQGRRVDLSNRQVRLWEKYQAKYAE